MALELIVNVLLLAASVFSAWGMLLTDVRHDYIQTKISRVNETPLTELNDMWNELLAQSRTQFARENVPAESVIHTFIADMRYMGQEHTVKVNVPPVPWSNGIKQEIIKRFHDTHEHFYTFRLPGTPAEIVNLHLVSHGRLEKPPLLPIAEHKGSVETALIETRPVYYADEGWQEARIYDRAQLGAGAALDGPAIVEEKSASTVVCPGQKLTVDTYGNLIITLEGKHGS